MGRRWLGSRDCCWRRRWRGCSRWRWSSGWSQSWCRGNCRRKCGRGFASLIGRRRCRRRSGRQSKRSGGVRSCRGGNGQSTQQREGGRRRRWNLGMRFSRGCSLPLLNRGRSYFWGAGVHSAARKDTCYQDGQCPADQQPHHLEPVCLVPVLRHDFMCPRFR